MRARHRRLVRLAKRIAGGEVVFFIGAGFSIDSERNTTDTLIARLLARIEALTNALKSSPDPACSHVADELSKGIRATFGLDQQKSSLFDPETLKNNLEILGRNYYLINDWSCSAFDQLLAALHGKVPGDLAQGDLAQKVVVQENLLLRCFWSGTPFSNQTPAELIDFAWYDNLRTLWNVPLTGHRDLALLGKVLFLETLGFNCHEVMGGYPLDAVVPGGEALLRPRHHVLAHLAAEGLCPALVTTNYDQLVECAYRDAGMLPRFPATSDPAKIPLNSRYRFFNRIAEATEFFSRDDSRGTALIHKIHGCAGTYRMRREADPIAFRDFLATIVFTYREIQNWREDSWSRDYLRTLLRTRTIVFAGYSGADPVLHDTIRTVYEEMASYQFRSGSAPDPLKAPQARAFFFGLESNRDFYGMEILRAASAASGGLSRQLSDHPNLITFYRANETGFPHLDEAFLWLHHLCYREIQKQVLQAELRRIAYQLFDRPCAENEATLITDSFRCLCAAEHWEARLFGAGNDDTRRRFTRMVAWTHGFHLKLMREFAIAETLLSDRGDRSRIRFMKCSPWYRPVSEHPQWAAWGVVIELATRRLLSRHQGSPDNWTTNHPHREPTETDPPAILFAASPRKDQKIKQGQAFVRRALIIECPAARGHLEPAARPRHLTALPPLIWQVGPGAVPWWSTEDKRRPKSTPDARRLWNWACGATSDDEEFLGEDPYVR